MGALTPVKADRIWGLARVDGPFRDGLVGSGDLSLSLGWDSEKRGVLEVQSLKATDSQGKMGRGPVAAPLQKALSRESGFRRVGSRVPSFARSVNDLICE